MFVAKYATDAYDFDQLIGEMIQIPLSTVSFSQDLFKFFVKNIGIRLHPENLDNDFIDFLVSGINNQVIKFQRNSYTFLIKETFKSKINQILEALEISKLSVIYELDTLLNRVLISKEYINDRTRNRMLLGFKSLIHPG